MSATRVRAAPSASASAAPRASCRRTRKHASWYCPDTLYQVAGQGGANTPYYDVVTGTNLYYPATAGYDLSTGLGTPNAPNLFNILLNSPVCGPVSAPGARPYSFGLAPVPVL